MKKSDLKDGMIVETKESRYLVVMNDYLIGQHGFLKLDQYNNDLKLSDIYDEYDIEKVYTTEYWNFGLANLLDFKTNMEYKAKLIWERPSREIDWRKVPKWTKVQVSDNGERWENAYFMEYNETKHFKHSVTKYDKFTRENLYEDDFLIRYKHCRIHPSVGIKEEWYK